MGKNNLIDSIEKAAKKELNNQIEFIKKIEGDSFIVGYNKDFYNNGVGWDLCAAPAPVYDEGGIKGRAAERMVELLKSGELPELFEELAFSKDFVSALVKIIYEL